MDNTPMAGIHMPLSGGMKGLDPSKLTPISQTSTGNLLIIVIFLVSFWTGG